MTACCCFRNRGSCASTRWGRCSNATEAPVWTPLSIYGDRVDEMAMVECLRESFGPSVIAPPRVSIAYLRIEKTIVGIASFDRVPVTARSWPASPFGRDALFSVRCCSIVT